MISKTWIKRAKSLGKIDDSDSPDIIKTCYAIFGEDFSSIVNDTEDFSKALENSPTQLFLLKEKWLND